MFVTALFTLDIISHVAQCRLAEDWLRLSNRGEQMAAELFQESPSILSKIKNLTSGIFEIDE